MRLFVVLGLLCTIVLSSAASQARRQKPVKMPAQIRAKGTFEAMAWPVESISLEGNKNYSREQILAAAGIKIGQKMADTDFAAARQRLLDSGVFESVGLKYGPGTDGKGYAVSLEVVEVEPVFPVRFEDLPAAPADLERVLKAAGPFYGPKIPATEQVLGRYVQVIETYLAGAKHPEKVAAKVDLDTNGETAVFFRPAAQPPAVSRVMFANAKAVPSAELENAINAVAVGRPFREARFRQLLDANVRPLYEAEGRVRVAFTEVKAEPDKQVKGVAVTVTVDEGPVYSYGNVQAAGQGVPAAELVKLAALKKGDAFNEMKVQEAMARILKRVRRDGYMKATCAEERQIDDKALTVGLTFRVDRGPQYVLGTLDIQGLDILTEPAIRKMWGIKPGQPFDADYPEEFLKQVRDEGVLDNLGDTRSKIQEDDAARKVDVTLVFKGAPPQPKKRPGQDPGPGGY
jgi:outer membrane protein insertion porin family